VNREGRRDVTSAFEAIVNALTTLAFVLHIGCGTAALLAGAIALSSLKGGTLHRRAGALFVIAMLIMAVAADYLAVVRPDQLPNLLVGTFTFYLITTAWLTVARPENQSGLIEKCAFAVILCLFVPFAVLSVQLATGMTPFLKSAVPFRGPVLVALYVFTLITGIAVVTDLKVLLAGGIAGRSRIERHLWRMCLGLVMAAGSAFTNGFPRLLPKGVHVPLIVLFMPQFFVLGVLFFWLIRVHFTRWYDGGSGPVIELQPVVGTPELNPAAATD
jgi:uncharacterized membrane protein